MAPDGSKYDGGATMVNPEGTKGHAHVDPGINKDALRSATIETAKLLGVEDKLGQIKKGMLADIIALQNNPLEDISIMKNVGFVMKDGIIFKQTF